MNPANKPKLDLNQDTHSFAAPVVRPLRILVVEDDLSLKEVIVRSFKKLYSNLEVKWATSADQFFLGQPGNLRKGHKTFDLVLTDINMPGACSGFEIWNHFTQNDPTIPVVIMSGLSEREFSSAMGKVDTLPNYVQKPLSLQKCAAVLEQHLGTGARDSKA